MNPPTPPNPPTAREINALMVRAYRWRDWAVGIEAAAELEAAGLTRDDFVPFVDTSEIVEYILPSSLLARDYATPLDLSLRLLFGKPDGFLYMFGPHVRELDGIRHGWEQRMGLVSDELKSIRDYTAPPTEVDAVRQELVDLARSDSNSLEWREDFITLVKNKHYLFFSAWRVPFQKLPMLFDRIRNKVRVVTRKDLGLPESWTHTPNNARVTSWAKRLRETSRGRGEVAANLIDAYVIDQLIQVAEQNVPGKLPILFSHSGKILEAIRKGRSSGEPDLLRHNGISLVQPPQVALIKQILADARESDTLGQVTEELDRQRERGMYIGKRIDEVRAAQAAARGRDGEASRTDDPVDPFAGRFYDFRAELAELETFMKQWQALEKIRQTLDQAMEPELRGMLEELQDLLTQADTPLLEESIRGELNNLLGDIDRLQGHIATRLLPPPENPAERLELADGEEGGMNAYVASTPTTLDRWKPPSSGVPTAVPTTAYPFGAFRFRDRDIIPLLEEVARLAQRARTGDEDETVAAFWRTMTKIDHLRDRPEYFLLLAVASLASEMWFQAYDVAREGLDLKTPELDGVFVAGRTELLLTRAIGARAWAHAARIDVPVICRTLLERAAHDCLDSLVIARAAASTDSEYFPDATADPRCLRELAVIVGCAQERVYGARGSHSVAKLDIDWAQYDTWVRQSSETTAGRFVAFAREAYELGKNEDRLRHFYTNTYLYALTEFDRRNLLEDRDPVHEAKREELAQSLEEQSHADANLHDSVMWHHHVTAVARRRAGQPWQDLAVKANEHATSVDKKSLRSNEFYYRLVALHSKQIAELASEAKSPTPPPSAS